ncbi:MAG: ABC transporter permease [Acidimicrobiia bacterium]|nr:ABC transporter permease [Acidimicrobiia bacterium]
MWRLGLRQLAAKKFRLLSTTMAVLLGVAFLAGSLVLVDTIGKTFDDLFAEIGQGVDAHVRSAESIESDFGDVRGTIDEALIDEIAAVDGVLAYHGHTEGFAQLIDKDGDAMGDLGPGPPTLGFAWTEIEDLNPMRLFGDESRAPGPGEVVIDRSSADTAGFEIGDLVTILLQNGPEEFVISGIATFGDEDSALGATMALFDTATAQRVLGEPGRLDSIDVVAVDGVSQEELRDRLAEVMPPAAEVLTGDQLIKENQDAVAESLGFFTTFMVVFAVVALFVGAFIIYNTFSIIVAQRAKEMALLRALGATSRQILASVQVEALVVGLIASLLGIVAGVGVAVGLKALLAGLQIDIPAGGVVFTSRTVVVSLIVGVGVTTLSAVTPALRAARTPPMAALREATVDQSGRSIIRTVIGTLITGAGVAAILAGLFRDVDNAVSFVGAGAVLVFLGVAALGPIIAGPVSALLGMPLRTFRGFPGMLASENAQRNPKRTSATASALMIGVGLVGFITIFAASATASIKKSIDDTFIGDIIVESGSIGFGGLSPDLATDLNDLPEVQAASGVRVGIAEVNFWPETVVGFDTATIEQVVDIAVTSGSLDDLGPNQIAVDQDKATEEGWAVGDTISARFADTGPQTLEIVAIFNEDADLADRYVMGYPGFEQHFSDVFDSRIYVITDPTVGPDEARVAVENAASGFPNADVQDLTEFKEARAAEINQILGLIYALLGLSIIIAVIGIANTLALSIVERTHELGLLRAVGLTRRQLRSAVRWESVIIALLGAVLGLAVGIFFGWAVVKALADDGFSRLVIPPVQLIVVALIAAIVGVLAAIGPARRAANLDILRAIGAE